MPKKAIVMRDESGKWLKGHAPISSGRPKGIVHYIKTLTCGGKDTVDFMVKIMKGKKPAGLNKTPSLYYRMDAAKWLFDKCFGSTPLVTEEEATANGYDIRRIVLMELTQKLNVPANGSIIDQSSEQAVETEQLLQDQEQEQGPDNVQVQPPTAGDS